MNAIGSKEKLTILISNLNHGGAEKVCVTLCNEMVKRGYRVDLWVLFLEKTPLYYILDNRINIVSLNAKTKTKTTLCLYKQIKKEKPAKILVFHQKPAIVLLLIRLIALHRFKIILRSSSTLSHKYKNKKSLWHKYIINKIYKTLLSRIDFIVSQSSGMCYDFLTQYNIKPAKITVIHNPPGMPLKLTSQNRVIKDKKRDEILFVGRLAPEKGLDYLLKAFQIALIEIPGLTLRIVGTGPQKKQLVQIVNQMGLEKNVIFEGFQLQTELFYRQAKATVLTSIYEGFPNVLVESIAVGTPAISFDCPSGPADIVVEGVNGFLVPQYDINKFGEAIINTVKNSPFDPKRVIESAKRFDIDKIIEQYMNVFNLS